MTQIYIIIALVVILSFLLVQGQSFNKLDDTQTPFSLSDSQFSLNAGSGKQSLQLGTLQITPSLINTLDCGGNLTAPEPEILWSLSPHPPEPVSSQIKAWYNDEHPLTLGSGSVSPWDSSSHVSNPINVGDETARDANGLPFFPALILTDNTTSAVTMPIKPNEVFGTWQALGANDSLPENFLNLPTGADPFPPTRLQIGGDEALKTEGYGALMVWNKDSLRLEAGHSYKAELVLHDGDSEGDIGIACFTINN